MEIAPIRIPDTLKKAAKIFSGASFQCWLVGGAIRDGLLGRESYDYDLATDATPKDVIKLFRRTIPTGIKHGTVSIILGRYRFETTSFRQDGPYSDGRHPDEVSFSESIDSDLARRDFTVNAMAWDLVNNRFFDPHGGKADLGRRLLRAIGNPEERLREDGLRAIRACRLASQLGFHIHPVTLSAISETCSNIENLSVERIWEEFKKILQTEKPSVAFLLFRQTGLIEVLFPEFDISVPPLGKHEENDFSISLRACDLANPGNFSLRVAALFHRLGCPTHPAEEGNSTFLGSVDMTRLILKRYKASNAESDRIIDMLSNLHFQYSDDWSDAEVRRFVSRIGARQVHNLVELKKVIARVNLSSSHSYMFPPTIPYRSSAGNSENRVASFTPESPEQVQNLSKRVNLVIESKAPLTIGDLAINGSQIMDNCHIETGPKLGKLLEFLLECVLENPKENSYNQLLWRSRSWLGKIP